MVGPHNFEYAETPIPEPKNDEVLVLTALASALYWRDGGQE